MKASVGSNPTGSSNAGIAQMVEHWPEEPGVVGSIPISCTKLSGCGWSGLSRLVWGQEHAGSNPAIQTKFSIMMERQTCWS